MGQLRYLDHWAGGQGRGLHVHGYVYEAAFVFHNIPADEHLVVRSSQIATVHEHFFADPASRGAGGWADEPIDPALGSAGRYLPGLLGSFLFPSAAMPGNLTVYVGTASGDQWAESTENATGELNLFDDPHTFLPGHTYRLDWQHGPLAPALGQHTGPWRCEACTAGRTLSLKFPTFGDSEPDHFAIDLGDLPHVHLALYRDGTRLLSTSGSAGAVVHNIPARPSTYRAVLDVSLARWPGVSQSTQTHTDLTMRYAPGAGAVLPASDTCIGRPAGNTCRVLPALTLGYQLATSRDNTSSSRTQVLHLRVGHVSYNGAGSHAPITSAAVWVSFDGGKSWQKASVTGSAGDYTATWPNPASARGTSPDIKVTAADAAGGSITQTITAAYSIAAASQHRSPR